MIRAVYRNGAIKPLDEVPPDWREGQELEIRTLPKRDAVSDTDDWINESGAFAGYTGEMPPHVREELNRRLAALHDLGPTEFEPGEREEIEKTLAEMDNLGRAEMQRLLDGRS
jgi:predicted DNA-binding antitoxin AbrB/MazE fold protein